MSDYTIYTNLEGAYQVDMEVLRVAAWYALQVAGAGSPAALTVTVTTTERIHELNRRYARIDEPTDVLSFGPEGEPYETEAGEPPYLGDVVIAYPVAERQAQAAGNLLLAELQMLAVHGTLHLLGYDHDTPERQAEMWAFQSAAMDALRGGKGL